MIKKEAEMLAHVCLHFVCQGGLVLETTLDKGEVRDVNNASPGGQAPKVKVNLIISLILFVLWRVCL